MSFYTLIIFNKNGIERKRLVSGISSCLCQLEPVYFMRADSELDGVEVRAMRRALGVRLAEDEPLKGKRQGQRSIRLNKGFRAIYTIDTGGVIHFLEIAEVNKHEY